MATRLEEVTLLEALRTDRGYSRLEVQRRTGVSSKTVLAYETLETLPSAKPLATLAELYGVKASELLDDLRWHARKREREAAQEARADTERVAA